jgi:transposase
VPQNFLFPQRDQPLLLPVDMREWLPEDDLVFVVLDAVATVDLGGFYCSYRADGQGWAAFDPEMMVALLLYGYCQGERSSRVIEKRCVRDVGYRVITGGLRPDHATIARFRARHEWALGGLFSQVLRLLAAGGMVALGTLSLDGTKLAGNASQKADKTLPQLGKLLAGAAEVDAAEDAPYGSAAGPVTPQVLARRADRRERLAAARDRLAAEDAAPGAAGIPRILLLHLHSSSLPSLCNHTGRVAMPLTHCGQALITLPSRWPTASSSTHGPPISISCPVRTVNLRADRSWLVDPSPLAMAMGGWLLAVPAPGIM